jgi:hypothetical protein
MNKEMEHVIRLAAINANQDSITELEFSERRDIIEILQEKKIIELGVGGNFIFMSKDSQDLYVESFDKEKMRIAREVTSKMEGVYMIIPWPDSQLIMDEEWFDSECHLADSSKGVPNSTYFVPVKRMDVLEAKYKEILQK